eukprot:131035-Pleurochrysis_carterae.AAC.1
MKVDGGHIGFDDGELKLYGDPELNAFYSKQLFAPMDVADDDLVSNTPIPDIAESLSSRRGAARNSPCPCMARQVLAERGKHGAAQIPSRLHPPVCNFRHQRSQRGWTSEQHSQLSALRR